MNTDSPMYKHVRELTQLVERGKVDETIKGKLVPKLSKERQQALEARLEEAKMILETER